MSGAAGGGQRLGSEVEVIAVAAYFVALDQSDQFVKAPTGRSVGVRQHQVLEFVERGAILGIVADLQWVKYMGHGFSVRGWTAIRMIGVRHARPPSAILPK